MGNLPKSEAALLESEPRWPFWLFRFQPANAADAAILRCGNVAERDNVARPRVEVPLDGGETKSEDYQMDTGTCAAQGPNDRLKLT
jgi:hypothetical protein